MNILKRPMFFAAVTSALTAVISLYFFKTAFVFLALAAVLILFVATKYNTIEYYQVCYSLENEDTEAREFGAYSGLEDNYPKYVISNDTLDFSQNGIIHKNIIDWLLED